LLGLEILTMLPVESGHRNQPVDVPRLSCCEGPAFETPVGSGLFVGCGGNFAVALRDVRNAIPSAARAVAEFGLRALQNVRELRIAANLTGICSRHHIHGRASAEDSSVALSAMPAQVFFREAAAERERERRSGAQRLSEYQILTHQVSSA
jgi:hypothetical protein